MEMIGIRVILTFNHFRDNHTCKTSGYAIRFFEGIHLDANGSHRLRDLGGGKVCLKIIL